MKAKFPYTVVDAFTDKPFHGNPAAVMLLPVEKSEIWYQQVAREFQLSDTAFLAKKENGFALRWFTPSIEVALCGHATLASAHALWEQGVLKPDQIARFWTKSGELTAKRKEEWIELDFPAKKQEPVEAPAGLQLALGATPTYIAKNQFDYLVELESESQLRDLQPNFHLLRNLPVRGVIVTARAQTAGFDFVSRFFAPGSGVDEDPVTGSAHCCLGPYWGEKLGKKSFVAYQASARGGTVRVELRGERVALVGQAVTVMRGELIAGE